MTVYRTPKGWRGRIQINSANGTRKPKTFYGQSEQEVRDKIKKFEETRNLASPAPDMTVADVCRIAIDLAVENELRPSTIRGYRLYATNHIIPRIGRIPVADLTAWQVERMLADLDLSRQSKQLVRAFLQSAINRVAKKHRIVRENAAQEADVVGKCRPSKKRPPITPEALDQILKAEFNPVRRALYLLLATTGLRPSEARHLTWGEIVERDGVVWIVLSQSKTEAGTQPVPLPAETWDEIKRLGRRAIFVFPSESGTPIGESNLRRAWLENLARAGLPETNLYALRKHFATVQAKEVSRAVLKRLMRHTDSRTSEQYYVKPFDSDLKDATYKRKHTS